MRLFHKENSKDPHEDISIKTGETLIEPKKLADELMRQHNAGVTRSDYWEVIINIVLETHPEMYGHPKMVEFMAKLNKYQDETPEGVN